MRFNVRKLLGLTVLLAILFAGVRFVLHIDDPEATVQVSSDPAIILADETAIELSRLALREAGLNPIRPFAAYGGGGTAERIVGRNTIRPDDRVTVTWYVRDGQYVWNYGVVLERTDSGVSASIYRHR